MRIERAAVRIGCVALALLALAGTTYRNHAGPAAPSGIDTRLVFVSRPDLGAPLTGPLILDAAGEPVWIHPLPGEFRAFDLRVQEYQRKPVLTWWNGLNL